MTTLAPPLEARPRIVPATNGETADQTVYLLGRPTLRKFIRFMRGNAVNPPDEATLATQWQAAHDHIRELEKTEAGLADNPVLTPITDLRERYEPLLIEFFKDPLVRYGFNTVPTDIALVELDRLVVYQKHIDVTHVEALKAKLGPAPSDEVIFRTCLSYDHPYPPVKWAKVHNDTYVFMSPSNDLRFLGTMPLKSEHIANYPPPGSVVGVVGIAVGFGSNFLNAIHAEGRVILNNGSHRAYALRDLGVTHVPAIIQHVSSRDELELVASDEVQRNPDAYLKHARPSMLKDYFDPFLRTITPVHRRTRQITVKFEVDDAYVPAL
ncbi:MAG: hypothetical protein AB1705_05130 [Verrucomicrobiota bacterium]